MDSRDKAIEELKKQLARTRAELGPEGVEQLQKMMKTASAAPDTVPYDRAAALRALSLFIKNHKNRELLEEQLVALLNKD